MATSQNAPGLAAIAEIDRDDGVDRLTLPGVIFAHADPSIATTVDHAVGKPPLRARAQAVPV